MEQIKEGQLKDPEIRRLTEGMLGHHDLPPRDRRKYTILETGLLAKKGKVGPRVVLSTRDALITISALHGRTHLQKKVVNSIFRKHFYAEGADELGNQLLGACWHCRMVRNEGPRAYLPGRVLRSTEVGAVAAIDHVKIYPVKRRAKVFSYVLSYMDLASLRMYVVPTVSTGMGEVELALKNIWNFTSRPKELLTDNAFQPLTRFLQDEGINHRLGLPNSSSSYFIERTHKILVAAVALVCSIHKTKDWISVLNEIHEVLWSTPRTYRILNEEQSVKEVKISPLQFTQGQGPQRSLNQVVQDVLGSEPPLEVLRKRDAFQASVAACELFLRQQQEEKDEEAAGKTKAKVGSLVLVLHAVRRKHQEKYRKELFVLEEVYGRKCTVRAILHNPGLRYTLHRKYIKVFQVESKMGMLPKCIQDALGGYVSRRKLIAEGVVPLALDTVQGSPAQTRTRSRRRQEQDYPIHTDPRSSVTADFDRSNDESSLESGSSDEEMIEMPPPGPQTHRPDASVGGSSHDAPTEGDEIPDMGDVVGPNGPTPALPLHQSTDSSEYFTDSSEDSDEDDDDLIRPPLSVAPSSQGFQSARSEQTGGAASYRTIPEHNDQDDSERQSLSSVSQDNSDGNEYATIPDRASSPEPDTERLEPPRTPLDKPQEQAEDGSASGDEAMSLADASLGEGSGDGDESEDGEPLYESIASGIQRSLTESLQSLLGGPSTAPPSVPSFDPVTPPPRLRRSHRSRKAPTKYSPSVYDKKKR